MSSASAPAIEGALLVALADGLGHGPEARHASRAAIDAITGATAATAPLPELVALAAQAVAGTRGAVLSLVRVDLASRAVEHAGVGDVRVSLLGPAGEISLPGVPGILTGRGGARLRVRTAGGTLSPYGALLVASDGLRSAAELPPGPVPEPIAAADELVERFGRNNDDVLVLIARAG